MYYHKNHFINALLASHKAFVDAFRKIAVHPKLTEHFHFHPFEFQQAHGKSMHYLNQYLRVFGCQTDLTLPFHRLTQGCPEMSQRIAMAHLERLVLQVAILGLVLKVSYQDYVLEHLPLPD